MADWWDMAWGEKKEPKPHSGKFSSIRHWKFLEIQTASRFSHEINGKEGLGTNEYTLN